MDTEDEVEETLALDLTSFRASLLYMQLQIAFSKYMDLIEYYGQQLKLPIKERTKIKGTKLTDKLIGETLGTYKAFAEHTADMIKDTESIVQELGTDDSKPKIIGSPAWAKS